MKLNSIFKKICISSDHAGYNLKEYIKSYFIKKEIPLIDLGPHKTNSVDYPDYAKKLPKGLLLKEAILVFLYVDRVPEWQYLQIKLRE